MHDTSAFEDEKVTELYLNFGYEGVGLFYVFLEKIGKHEKPVKTSVLKAQLKVGKKLEKCWNFMEKIGLISSNNGETFNKQLLNFSEKFQIKKEKNKKRILQWRENQALMENVTHSENVRNARKDNNININITTSSNEEEKKVEVPSNLLETNQVSEKLETGIPPAIPVMGKEPAEINRSQIADECKSDPILTNEEHLKNLMTDKYGEQRQAIQKKFGSKNDMNLFEFVLKEFNDHRGSINKIEDTHFQYSKHLNNWLNYKGQEKVKELLQKYQQTQTPNPKAKYSHYGF
jgi:hypothetical protein